MSGNKLSLVCTSSTTSTALSWSCLLMVSRFEKVFGFHTPLTYRYKSDMRLYTQATTEVLTQATESIEKNININERRKHLVTFIECCHINLVACSCHADFDRKPERRPFHCENYRLVVLPTSSNIICCRSSEYVSNARLLVCIDRLLGCQQRHQPGRRGSSRHSSS